MLIHLCDNKKISVSLNCEFLAQKSGLFFSKFISALKCVCLQQLVNQRPLWYPGIFTNSMYLSLDHLNFSKILNIIGYIQGARFAVMLVEKKL